MYGQNAQITSFTQRPLPLYLFDWVTILYSFILYIEVAISLTAVGSWWATLLQAEKLPLQTIKMPYVGILAQGTKRKGATASSI